MTAADWLIWARGPGFNLAVSIMLIGIVIRLFEIFMLGRAPTLYEQKGEQMASGVQRIFRLFKLHHSGNNTTWYAGIASYVFHIGFIVIGLFYIPHIMIANKVWGLSWPGLPSPIIDALAVISMIALLVKLIIRLTDAVQIKISNFEDYLVWLLTFLPFLTGYMAFHRMGLTYQGLLATHILSVELLMAVLPFSKLVHSVTIFISRWYNGAIAGSKGVTYE